MRYPIERAQARRWPLIAASVLVFLFAFHAKTGVYDQGLTVKPHTATSSKLWVKSQKIPKPALFPIFIANAPLFDCHELTWGLLFLRSQDASGFVPVRCFSGLSPPLIAQERL
jgi:hypothetical protein